MKEQESDIKALYEHLKRMAISTNAGRAYVDFTFRNGDILRVEYKSNKKHQL